MLYACILFLQWSYLLTFERPAKHLMPSVCVLCCTVVSDSFWPPGPPDPARLLCQWNCLGKNTGVECHFLFQGIFPTQGLNPCLPVSPALAGRFFTTVLGSSSCIVGVTKTFVVERNGWEDGWKKEGLQEVRRYVVFLSQLLKCQWQRCSKSMVLQVWSQANSIHSTWELVRDANLRTPPQTYWIRNWGWNPILFA